MYYLVIITFVMGSPPGITDYEMLAQSYTLQADCQAAGAKRLADLVATPLPQGKGRTAVCVQM